MLALKIIGGIVAALGTWVVVVFVYFFVQATAEGENFRKDCQLLSDNRLTHESAWHCNDNITYWKRDGVIFSRLGTKGDHPKY